MKTKSKIISLLASFVILVSFNTKAQCPAPTYKLSSNLGCSVTVDIVMYKPSPGCTAVCNTILGLVVPPGGVISIPCGSCINICDIDVTVIDLGGTTISVLANFSTGFPGNILGSGGPPCTVVPATLPYICYDATGSTFKIHQ